ncbi:metal-binding protein [Halobacteriales archaeon QS_1_68_17]|nr:MAG: metal-binding protein [Halobacteriales archaeon QS_1_68_17]
MKKQELIHLHGLLAQVESHFEERTGGSVEHEEYSRLGVRPTSIHKSKTDHKAAVFALADGITSEMTDTVEQEKEQEQVPAAAD